MSAVIPHEWLYPPDMEEAKKIQKLLSKKVISEDRFGPILLVGGADVSNTPGPDANQVFSAIVTLGFPSLKLMESAHYADTSDLPYMPGFLGFREVPCLIQAFHRLTAKPDLLLVDGHGISHPRGLGVASHIGVLLDLPTIGVAKSILVGRIDGELGEEAGATAPLIHHGKTIGMAVRSKPNTLPLFISTGHRISLDSAVQWLLNCVTRYRLPEPTRLAHLASNHARKAGKMEQLSLNYC
jgi:deoxyribonuclease V